MSFWTDFQTELTAAVAAAKAEITAVEQYFVPKVEAAASEIASVALTAVLTQAPLVLSGAEKLSAATSSVISTIASNGKTVAIGIAETAVQAAVNAITPVKAA